MSDLEPTGEARGETSAAQTKTVGEEIQRVAARVSLSATGGFAVVAYVVLRIAASEFYTRFGVSPEDVGIGQPELLARSAGTAIVALVFAGVVAVAFAAIDGLVRLIRGRGSGCLVAFLTAGLGGLLGLVLGLVSKTAGDVAVVALVWAAALGLALSSAARVWRMPARGLAVVLGFAAPFALSVALVIAVLFVAASTGPGIVLRGQGISDFAVPWKATVITAEWAGPGAAPVNLAHLPCGVYLGSGAGKAIIVDPVSHETLWIPADRVILRSYLSSGSEEPICTRNGVTHIEVR